MIKYERLTPQVYYKESRDFQLFGRIYDVIFNYLKYNTLIIQDYSKNINTDSKLLELMCNTLGFKTKHNYNDLELSALCSIFLKCMKAKGSIKAIKLLLDMITCIENSSSEAQIIRDYEGQSLSILIPADITDWTLIRDVMDYIMPAGSSYLLQSQTLIESPVQTNIQLTSKVDSNPSWSVVTSSIIRMKNGTATKDDILNYNVKMTLDSNNHPTTGSVGNKNTNLSSVETRITSFDSLTQSQDANQNRIGDALLQATKYQEPVVEESEPEESEPEE